MMDIVESAEVLRAYLDESAACVPPRVYGAISTAVAVMDAASKTFNAAQSVCVEGWDGR